MASTEPWEIIEALTPGRHAGLERRAPVGQGSSVCPEAMAGGWPWPRTVHHSSRGTARNAVMGAYGNDVRVIAGYHWFTVGAATR